MFIYTESQRECEVGYFLCSFTHADVKKKNNSNHIYAFICVLHKKKIKLNKKYIKIKTKQETNS